MFTKIIRSITVIVIIVFFVFWFIRYYQTHGIYFPAQEIHYTPAQVGLEYREINFKADDGVQLNGWFVPKKSSRATLLFLHGNAGNISHRVDIIKLFHHINLNVFIFDYRGYGRSKGKPSEKGLYKDALAAYTYLINEMGYDPEEIVIYGKSVGANVAIDLACKVKAAGLISDGAFCSAIHMSKVILPFLAEKWIDKAAESDSIQRKLKRWWLLLIEFDALSKIHNIRIPKLIIHSKEDEMIPFNQGKKLFEAAPEPKEFYKMYGGHNEAILIYKYEYMERITGFLKKYLLN